MINRVILIGRLTADPDLRYSPTGVAIANFKLAVDRNYSSKDGKREADFPNIVVFKGIAENVANYLKKGSLCAVEGRIQTRSYDNSEGKKVYVTEVVAENVRFLDGKPKTEVKNPFDGDSTPIDIDESELPFF